MATRLTLDNGTLTSAASSTSWTTTFRRISSQSGSFPQLMVAKKDLPADSLKNLVNWMKANPGKINFVNQNAAANVTGVLFEKLTGQKVQFIPYRGAWPAMIDLVSGQVD